MNSGGSMAVLVVKGHGWSQEEKDLGAWRQFLGGKRWRVGVGV